LPKKPFRGIIEAGKIIDKILSVEIKIRNTNELDLKWIRSLFVNNWGSDFIVSRGRIQKPENLEGIIVEENGEKVGLATLHTKNGEMELVTIDSLKPGRGIGTLLINEVIKIAKENKLKRLWLITTNDNLGALKFYQKNGFSLIKVYPNAIAESRKVKPQIPEIGENGIPIRDEIELEIKL
jgi:N-acetylglutamate synthase-like GNAT family acetyltransferase